MAGLNVETDLGLICVVGLEIVIGGLLDCRIIGWELDIRGLDLKIRVGLNLDAEIGWEFA